jgi:hypothetical protein
VTSAQASSGIGQPFDGPALRCCLQVSRHRPTYEAWDTPPDTLEGRVTRCAVAASGRERHDPHKETITPLLDGVEPLSRRKPSTQSCTVTAS